MKIDLLKNDGTKKSSIELNGDIFGLEVREDILARVIHWQLAKRQAGTHQTKQRSDVVGSTKKIVKQKGTGGARHGNRKATQFRGGGVSFGPQSRSHAYDLPKKIRKLGLKMALSAKVKSGDLLVLENVAVKDSKTKNAQALFLKIVPNGALIIDQNNVDATCKNSVSNLHKYDILPAMGANVYDIIRKEKLIITQEALKGLEERLK